MTNAEAMGELERVRALLVDSYRTGRTPFTPQTPEGLEKLGRAVSAIDRALDVLRGAP